MNEHMRRYLSEDLDDEDYEFADELEEPTRERERRSTPNPVTQARRQAQKEWGQKHTKAGRSSEKYQRNRKP